MNTKNEVFEYLIDQLRQQLPVVDVMGEIQRWSIDRSIAGRGNYTDEENAIIDAYIGMEHNPYKQQCEDLAHEVQSLKNQLRDMSELVDELLGAITLMNGQSCRSKEDTKECEHEWRTETLYGARVAPTCGRKCGGYKQKDEKNDTQGCAHEWLHSKHKSGFVCFKCGACKECEHEWQFYGVGFPCMCIKCGLKK